MMGDYKRTTDNSLDNNALVILSKPRCLLARKWTNLINSATLHIHQREWNAFVNVNNYVYLEILMIKSQAVVKLAKQIVMGQ